MDRGAGRVAHVDGAGLDRGREARRGPVLAERDRGSLHARDATGADQHVHLETALRHAHDMQTAHAAPHELAHGRHGATGVVGRQRNAGAVGDKRCKRL